MKRLEQENARLKKLAAKRDLEIEVMKEIAEKIVGVPARRDQVTHATRRGVSQRRACTLLRVARSALGSRSRLAVKDAPVLTRMAVLSGQYSRYGYRRIRIFLDRDGHAMSAGRPRAPRGANQVWAIEADGRTARAVSSKCSRDRSVSAARPVTCVATTARNSSRAVLKWIVEQSIGTAFIDPGKPWQNGVNESFNVKFHDECLSLEWFRARAEAKIVIET